MRNLGIVFVTALAAAAPAAATATAQVPVTGPPRSAATYSIARIDAANAPASLLLFDAMDGAMDGAMDRLAALAAMNDSASALANNIRTKTSWLRGRLRNAQSDPLAFRQSLAYDVAVARAAAADGDAERLVKVLRAINDDVEEKAEHCRLSPSGMATSVRVSIKTLSDGKESPNWEVLYMPKIMEFASDAAAAAMQFRVFSSPAVEDLAPGRYVVWARRPGPNGIESARTTIRVGGGGAALEQEIAVPQ
jgi:hypothetical protein